MTDRLLTLADLATTLQCSTKTARRRVLEAMEKDPGLKVPRCGRKLLFTPDQLQRIIRALEWRSTYGSEATPTTRAAPSASAAKLSRSPNSAQDNVRELTQKLQRKPKPADPGSRACWPCRAGARAEHGRLHRELLAQARGHCPAGCHEAWPHE